VAQLSANGKFTFTETNAYSGNNGRAAIEAKVNGKYYIYTAGNAGNGSNPQPEGVVLGAWYAACQSRRAPGSLFRRVSRGRPRCWPAAAHARLDASPAWLPLSA
jgi:hypothetical protein